MSFINENNTSTHRQCNVCREVKELNSENFHKDSNGKGGFSYTCKPCNRIKKRGRYKPNSQLTEEEIIKRREKSKSFYYREDKKVQTKIRNYKNQDNKKGLETNLTEEFVESCLNSKCSYCGFESTGLDRIDNNKGHTNENCIPCCGDCNLVRGNRYSVEEMKLIGQVLKLIKLNRLLKE